MYFTLSTIFLFTLLPGSMSMPTLIPRTSTSLSESSFDLGKMKTLFSFGDSYTTEYLDLPTMTYPNPDAVSSTNGFNWVHYFTSAQHLVDWDLAYNSAPIENQLVNQDPNVIDLSKQITQLFPQYFLQKNAKWPKEETLYSVWVGINDLGLLLNNETTSLDILMQHYRQLIDYLYDHNARNFVLINVPPIDRSPKWASAKTASKMQTLVADFNRFLLQTSRAIAKEKKNGHFFFVDAWSIFNDILDHPHQYGFENTTGYCPDWRHPEDHGCLPITKYFWLNDLHPTTKVHFHFATAVQHFLES